MPLKVIRNNITKMKTDAIVNTANPNPVVGVGCDEAIYNAAGFNELLNYRRNNIGKVKEGESFITPSFNLPCKYIIHTISPYFIDGKHNEEEKLRNCYRNSLKLAKKNNIKSIAFPLIATGTFKFPKREGLRFAMDEINNFLLEEDMEVYIVTYDDISSDLAKKLYPNLESFLDENYVPLKSKNHNSRIHLNRLEKLEYIRGLRNNFNSDDLDNVLYHADDTFSTKLMDLISEKNLKNVDVYKSADVDKKTFSKIKSNSDYHPSKYMALKLCIGAKLTVKEAEDLLRSAGYSFSETGYCDLIFRYHIENADYDINKIKEDLDKYNSLPKDKFID